MKKLFTVIVIVMAWALGSQAAVVDTVLVSTRNLATPMKVAVTVPEHHDTATAFPVVYLLHGYGGDYTDWFKHQPRIKDLADDYGIIIVNPDGRNSWYMDSPMDSTLKMETFFVEDLIPFIDNNFPTIPDRTKRAITGLSMGGHGALYLAFRHPDVFGNAGTMSGGVDILPFKNRWSLTPILGDYEQHPDNWENATVINLVDSVEPGKLNIIIDCGTEDFFAEVNENLHKALLDKKIPHDYTSRPGSHSWNYWNNSVLYHLLFFNEAFNADKP